LFLGVWKLSTLQYPCILYFISEIHCKVWDCKLQTAVIHIILFILLCRARWWLPLVANTCSVLLTSNNMCCVAGSFVGFTVVLECNGHQLPSNFTMFWKSLYWEETCNATPSPFPAVWVKTSFNLIQSVSVCFPSMCIQFCSVGLYPNKCCDTVPLNTFLYTSLYGKVTFRTYSLLQ
jgi:hypothetical protein